MDRSHSGAVVPARNDFVLRVGREIGILQYNSVLAYRISFCHAVCAIRGKHARVAELAYAHGLGPCVRKDLRVQISPLAPFDFLSREAG